MCVYHINILNVTDKINWKIQDVRLLSVQKENKLGELKANLNDMEIKFESKYKKWLSILDFKNNLDIAEEGKKPVHTHYLI